MGRPRAPTPRLQPRWHNSLSWLGNGDYIDRNIFSDIGPESWHWRKDRSYDGGKTWLEGVAFIDATRVKQ